MTVIAYHRTLIHLHNRNSLSQGNILKKINFIHKCDMFVFYCSDPLLSFLILKWVNFEICNLLVLPRIADQ
jgi:hypothetical protein